MPALLFLSLRQGFDHPCIESRSLRSWESNLLRKIAGHQRHELHVSILVELGIVSTLRLVVTLRGLVAGDGELEV